MTNTLPTFAYIAHKRRLANFLSSQHLRVEYSLTAKTAQFYPSQKGEMPLLKMPVLNVPEDIHDGFLLHEIGHALYTPQGTAISDAMQRIDPNPKNAKRVHHYLNVVEDMRIERMIKRSLPGAKRFFYLMYEWWTTADFCGLRKLAAQGKSLADLNLIDRILIHYKQGAFISVPFKREEMPLVNRVAETETWDEVVALTKEIYDFAKQQDSDLPQEGEEDQESGKSKSQKSEKGDGSEKPEDQEDGEGGEEEMSVEVDEDGEGEGEEGESESDDADAESDDAEGESDDAEGESDADADPQGDDEVKGEKDDKSVDADDSSLDSLIDASIQAAVESCVSQGKNDLHYCTIPEPTNGFTVDISTTLADLRSMGSRLSGDGKNTTSIGKIARLYYPEWLRQNRASVMMLGTEFDLRKAANEFRRTATSDSGVIDMSRLHAYRVSEDIFLRTETVADGQNHGMVMLIDMSASMPDRKLFYESMSQAIMLAHFCRRANKPFRIYGFTSRENREIAVKGGSFAKGNFGGEFIGNRVVTLLQDGMAQRDFVEACGLLLVGSHIVEETSSVRAQTPVSAFCKAAKIPFSPTMSMIPNWLLMGDTPLNSALLGMLKVCEDFKRSRNLQLVNLVVLTDGDPNDHLVRANRSTVEYCNKFASVKPDNTPYMVWHDPRTGNDYPVPNDKTNSFSPHEPSSLMETKVLLDIFHDRVGGKAICMSLTDEYEVRSTAHRAVCVMQVDDKGAAMTPEMRTRLADEFVARWRKDGWSAIRKAGGYDEYIGISLSGSGEQHGTEDAAAATDALLRKRKGNRPLLVRVAELISK